MRKRQKKIDFYQMIIDHAEMTYKGLEILLKYCEDKDPATAEEVIAYEEKADGLRREMVIALNKTFVTPIDREDIFKLSSAVDDVIDYAKNAILALKNYNVEPDSYFLRMSTILRDIASGLHKAAKLLKNNKEKAAEECYMVKKLENKANRIYMEALSKLFNDDDFKKILIYRELYRHLNNAADKGDNAADIFLNIIVKI